MKDKTEKQLKKEMESLRLRISELEAALAEREPTEDELLRERSHRLLLALGHASQAVQRARTADEVFRAIGKEISELGYQSTVFILNDERTHLVAAHLALDSKLVRAAEKLTGLSARGYRYPLTGGFYHRVVFEGKTILSDPAADPIYEALPRAVHPLAGQLARVLGIKQAIYAPLIVEGEPQGLMTVIGADLREDYIPAITVFANQAAIALKNARLYEELQRELAERERAQEALRESEERYRKLIESGEDLVFSVDRKGLFRSAGGMRLSEFGLKPDEVVGKSLERLFGPEEGRLYQGLHDRVFESGEVLSYEHTYEFAGVRRTDLTTVYPLRSGSGKVEQVGVICRDITERKQAEESLRESEERYRHLVEMSPDLIAVHKDGMVVFINEAGLRLVGASSREEVVGRQIADFVIPEQRDVSMKRIRDLLKEEGGSSRLYEQRILKMDGSIIDVEVTGVSLAYLGGMAVQIIARDITERKQMEEEIRRRNRELALLNRVIVASASSLDAKAIMETTCREMALAFGVPKVTAGMLDEDRASGTTLAEYLEGEQPPSLGRVTEIKESFSPELLLSLKEPMLLENVQDDLAVPMQEIMGRNRTASLLILPIIINDELAGGLTLHSPEPRHFSVEEVNLARRVAEQVSGALARVKLEEERRRLEERYFQAQKMEAVGLLAGGIAHDFNNLLTAILGFSDLLLYEIEDEALRKDVETIRSTADKAKSLTRQLLLFARRQAPMAKVLDVNSVVADMEKMLRRLIGEDIELVISLETKPGEATGKGAFNTLKMKADRGQLEQVILNLVVNSYDAMPDGGRLTVQTESVVIDEHQSRFIPGARPGRFICLSIEDTGKGMDEETRSHIFEPYFTTKNGGTGLGMAVVYGIVQQHEGWINIYSEPGQGSTFKIYLPTLLSEPELEEERLSVPERLTGRGERILLVEDQNEVREFAERVLEENGYVVFAASSVKEALEVFDGENGEFDLIFSDVVLPDRRGIELAELLLSHNPDLNVLLSSGYTQRKSQLHIIEERGFPFLQKPYSLKELLRTVAAVIGRQAIG